MNKQWTDKTTNMGLLPLEFTDALQDSPYFRWVVRCFNYSGVNPVIFLGIVYIVTKRSWREQVIILKN